MQMRYRNVNDAFKKLTTLFDRSIKSEGDNGENILPLTKSTSRNGNVWNLTEPAIISYSHPTERVLFNSKRDANPFFHLYESMWMLAGRNDVAPLKYFSSQVDKYSDDGQTLNGAYGYRWRNAERRSDSDEYEYGPIDQLEILIDHLKCLPDSRRAVLAMWNVEDDLLKIGSDLDFMQGLLSKDVCCNLNAIFSIRTERMPIGTRKVECAKCAGGGKEYDQYDHDHDCPFCDGEGYIEEVDTFPMKCLDMTVTNRSNDMIWGMLGANFVHFSFLQEYLASALGVEVGTYHQITNNLHVYEWNWNPELWLSEDTDYYTDANVSAVPSLWGADFAVRVPLKTSGQTIEELDREIELFVRHNTIMDPQDVQEGQPYQNDFLRTVAQPMMDAFHCHKLRSYATAYQHLDNIASPDWRIACHIWIQRRHESYVNKNASASIDLGGEG